MTDARLITDLDVPRWRAHLATTGETLHVYVNGLDLTRDSYRAVFCEDGLHGYVWRYRRNAQGQHYREPGQMHAAYVVLFGLLTIAPGDPI